MIWAKRFFADLGGTYIDSLRAIGALPWLFAAIIGWEFAQHVVEVRIGMFESVEAAKAVGMDASRMVFGWIKMLSIYIGAFFVIRHFAGSRGGRTLASLQQAAKRFVPYTAYSLLIFAGVFYARDLVAGDQVDVFRGTLGLGQLLIEPLLMAWVVAAATDGRIGNPWASARRTGLLYLLALPLYLLARVPVGLLHNGLNEWAMGTQGLELWSLLAIDSFVLGIIVAIVPAAMVRVARWVDVRSADRDARLPAGRAIA